MKLAGCHNIFPGPNAHPLDILETIYFGRQLCHPSLQPPFPHVAKGVSGTARIAMMRNPRVHKRGRGQRKPGSQLEHGREAAGVSLLLGMIKRD